MNSFGRKLQKENGKIADFPEEHGLQRRLGGATLLKKQSMHAHPKRKKLTLSMYNVHNCFGSQCKKFNQN